MSVGVFSELTRHGLDFSTLMTIFFGHVIRIEELEHLVTTGIIEEKCSRGQKREKILDGFPKWLKVGRVITH